MSDDIAKKAVRGRPFRPWLWSLLAGATGLSYFPGIGLTIAFQDAYPKAANLAARVIMYLPAAVAGLYLVFALLHYIGPKTVRRPAFLSLVGVLVLMAIVWLVDFAAGAVLVQKFGMIDWIMSGDPIGQLTAGKK
ncbi:hypothetical protein ABAC460_14915 [Asticcacaulis sp. AC460]|uniref:hypothetical protein n=1 Tax=Asticcacaulis sp. AC460 TaxID=1282360 RepID=UPI0003C3BDFF|nr:hypothetical protein [Asticcacaulis sp. AC460]ESQ88739.1 hypothetical protein ABAC460_14915 [Asticcacaulis sp. AC460]